MYLRELKNERIATGFDRLASAYSSLSKVVFGVAPEQAQQHFITSVNAGDCILILGGGSGDFLKSLLKHQAEITVDYIDISQKMIRLAREKTHNPSNVNFIAGTEQVIPNRKYTVIITNFYLDLFSDNTLQNIVQKIKTHLTPGARWLATDFVSKKGWHKIMLWMMYRFFRIAVGIEAKSLPRWEEQVERAGLAKGDSKVFFGGFIKSCRYTFDT